MNQTRNRLTQLAYAVGLIGITLNILISLLDLDTRKIADAIQMMAPALLYGFSLWLMRTALSGQGTLRRPIASGQDPKTPDE